jgi:hypothetical protein
LKSYENLYQQLAQNGLFDELLKILEQEPIQLLKFIIGQKNNEESDDSYTEETDDV